MTHSSLANPSAALAVLQRHGLHTKKRLGQHLLVDDNVVGRILDLAGLHPDDVVCEVGPGIGTLTVALCDAVSSVVAVERDSALLGVLADTTGRCPGLAVVHGDAVTVAPDVLEAPFGPVTALVANLPYNVAATVVLRFFQEIPSLSQATVMVQSEVADRMVAAPGGKEYGAYSVKLQLNARPAGRFAVSPTCFLPPPRVSSAVVRLERIDRGASPEVLRASSAIANAAFAQRRKRVRNALKAGLGIDEGRVGVLLAAADVDGDVRAENITVEGYLRLGAVGTKQGLLP